MSRVTSLFAIFAVAALVFAPDFADARAGGGRSAGSRGERTFQAPPATATAPRTAAPMERTATQAPPTGAMAAAAPARSGFGAGLMGGLFGVGLGGLLFGSGMFGGLGGLVGLLGFALQAALAFFAIRWLVRRFSSSRTPAMAGGPATFARTPDLAPAAPMGRSGGAPGAAAPLQIQEADYQAFDRLLQQVQSAWTARNVAGLRALATPEMAGYFSEQLAAQSASGRRNEVTAVKLEQGDLAEAWREGSTEYATVAMRFSMIDVTRDQSGAVVEGDPANRAMATEVWTFARVSGRPWAVSAIQQTR